MHALHVFVHQPAVFLWIAGLMNPVQHPPHLRHVFIEPLHILIGHAPLHALFFPGMSLLRIQGRNE